MEKITNKEKIKYSLYGVLTLGIIALGAKKLDDLTKKGVRYENKLEQKMNSPLKDSIPQVTNYQPVGPIDYVWKDPIKNVYKPRE